jgi:hypothetical protein
VGRRRGENNGALAEGTVLSASACFPFCGACELVPVYSTRRCKRWLLGPVFVRPVDTGRSPGGVD